MNGYLRQSTASQSRLIGPFVDDTDFKTAEPGLTIANTDIKLRANGTTLSNKNSGGATHQVNGTYSVTWDATDTANVGELFYSVLVSGALLVWGTYTVLEEAVYDALFAASAPGYVTDQPVNATKIGGTTQTGRDIGASVLLSPGTGTGQVDLSSGKVLLQATQTGVTIPTVTSVTNDVGITQAGADKVWTSATRTLTAFSTALAVSVWDVLTANISTASSIGLKLKNWVLGSDSKVLLSSDAQTDVTIPTVTSVTNGVTVTTNNDKTGYGLSAAAVQAIWDALTSALTTAGSIGKRIVDFLTGDAFARLGDPAGASISADMAAIKSDTGAIKTKTDNLPASPAAVGSPMTLEDDAITASKIAADAIGASELASSAVSEIQSGIAGLDASGVRAAIGLASANLDSQLAGISDKTDNLPANPAAVSDIPTAEHIANLVWNLPFPVTGILDDSNRSDEGPPPSSNWTTGVGLILTAANVGHRVVSNQFRRQIADDPEAESRWSAELKGPDCEAYITVTSFGVNQVVLGARLTNIGAGTTNGYAVAVSNSDYYQIWRIDDGVATFLVDDVVLPTIVSGNSYGIRIIGSLIQFWINTGTGWIVVAEAEDSTHAGAGELALLTSSSAASTFDNFGGGTIPDIFTRQRTAIADAVWDEDIVSNHTDADTAGKKLSQALILYEGS